MFVVVVGRGCSLMLAVVGCCLLMLFVVAVVARGLFLCLSGVCCCWLLLWLPVNANRCR